ncbi:hypothetical protein EG329_001255 [Mollisiaceae sp. DMI_Dod_QoI]|nr:hypothetical protein EG329_001255 [Helotiales sp. DMI_Dod_QoI]
MANTSEVPIACSNIGTGGSISCCYPSDQSSSACQSLFPAEDNVLVNGCLTGNCVNNCDPMGLYNSSVQQNGTGNGQLPILKYLACVNIPSIASYGNQSVLSSNISKSIEGFLFSNTSQERLQRVTSAVTDCISSTCRSSRNSFFCYPEYCSPVKLLRNDTSPNLDAINTCLNTLCSNNVKSLPWADADVIGIGVFASYVMQCISVVVLWFGLLGFAIHQWKRGEPERPSEPGKHYGFWIDLLLDFHKSQCFFSATLMIASLNYGIYEVDMQSSTGVTLLTVSTYALSTMVYWSLYWHFIPLGDFDAFNIYQNFRFKLSSLPVCGGYSGLSVCPNNESMNVGLFNASDISHRMQVLTPLIWTYSTLILCALLAYQLYRWRSKREINTDSSVWHWAFWLATIVFLAAIGMQLNVLWISTELHMIDPNGWTFGQIIAVTVWIPPLMDYIYCEIREILRRWQSRTTKSNAEKEIVRSSSG